MCCWGRLSDVCIVTVQPGVFSQSKDVQDMYFKQFVEETPRLERSLNDTAAALRIQFIFLFV